jgi:hypothetical protein
MHEKWGHSVVIGLDIKMVVKSSDLFEVAKFSIALL